MDTYLPILDSLTSQLAKRAEAYENIGELFSFFNQLKTIDSDELSRSCEKLAKVYHEDLDYHELLNECKQFKHHLVLDEKCTTLPDMYRKLISDQLKYVFPELPSEFPYA